MSDIGIRGAPVPQTAGGRHVSALQIGEIVLIAILVVATAVFGFQWTQAQSRANSAQGQVATAQADAATQKQIARYTGIYAVGAITMMTSLSDMSSALNVDDLASARVALGQAQTALNTMHSQMSGVTVPPVLATADSEFHQGIDLMSGALTSLDQALATGDYDAAIRAMALADEASKHLDAGETALFKVIGVTGRTTS